MPEHSVELLVDDALGRQFMTALPAQPVTTAMQSVLAQAETVPEGAFQNTDGFRYVFTEYLPYPDQLISWVLAARISPDLLAADLRLLRKGLIAMAVVTLLVGLLLSGWVARHLAKPICRLAENIKAYGRGEMQAPTIPSSIQEVNQVQQSFAGMADTLKQTEQQLLQSAKMASIGEMAAGIGHELNNPLNNMLSLGKLLQRNEALDDNGQKDVDALLEETRRASKIVQGILNFARQTPLQYEQFDLGEFLENCRRRVADLAAEKQVKIQIEFAETILMEADPGQLEQVMVNLLMNAIQASAASSAVEIHAEKNTGQVIIRVKDEGAGLTEIAKTKLFEPFFTTKAVGEGSGLGLSISLGIVESHGGELTIENHPAGGVVAEIKIPEKHA
ncbi:MAG TPA: HAMP domain-containing histidine kinase [Thiotrichales bacterium]|nr:HAMP domain-containing histidine kinase [Thiotrichales bacterium]